MTPFFEPHFSCLKLRNSLRKIYLVSINATYEIFPVKKGAENKSSGVANEGILETERSRMWGQDVLDFVQC